VLRSPAPAIIAPLMRAMVRTPVAAVAVLAAAPSVYATARGHHDLSFPVTVASVVGAASVAFAIDDPAEATLTPCPVPRSTRRWTRGALISLAVVASWVIVVVSAHAADYSLNPLRPRIAETAAAAAFAIAFAVRAGRDGSDSPGLSAVTATLLTFGVCSGLALSITWLPQLGHPQHATRWWIVASAAATAAWWWSRDPSARLRLRSSQRQGTRFP
jgi:hypothetical protein